MISKDDCLTVLHNYLQTTNIELVSFKKEPFCKQAQGIMGEHYKICIKYKHNNNDCEQIFFLKKKPTDCEAKLYMVEQMDVFNKEIFIYDNLLKQFEELGYDVKFAPKCYYCIPDQALFLEELTTEGFSTNDRREVFTLEQMKQVLKCVAMYHAAGFALERTKSKELGRHFCLGEEYKQCLREMYFVHYIDKNMYAFNAWVGVLNTLRILIDYLPEDAAYKTDLRYMIDNYEFGKSFVMETNISKVCSHGDLWSNNILFKYKNNSLIDCKLVDFQAVRYFYPSFDVLLAILYNTTAEIRRNNLEELYEYYYYTLAAYLEKYGYDVEEIHPKKDFYRSVDLVKVEAILQMMLLKVVTSLPAEKYSNKIKEETGTTEMMFKNDDLAVAAFKDDEYYRKTISEAIYEMRNALLEKFTSM